MICSICPRKCGIDRSKSNGYCKSPEDFVLARAALHFWEEPCISGKNGSGAVFFSGCNLGCVFCQNEEISHLGKGVQVSEDRLVQIFDRLVEQGASNINLVNPTHYALKIARVLERHKPNVPIVYNSSGYESVETLKRLEGLVDVYLPDFKYTRADRAMRYCGASDYPERAKKAIFEMRRQQKTDVFDDKGIMLKGVIVRHLVLPANTNSAIEAVDFIADELKDTYLSLMAQYTPCGNLNNFPEINRKITEREYNKVVDYAIFKGLNKVFIQELESSDKKYIPPFDLTGII